MKKFVPKVGMFCYQDRTFSFSLIKGKVVSGIVGYVGRKGALVVSLKEICLPWSSDFFDMREAIKLRYKALPYSGIFKDVYVFRDELDCVLKEAHQQGKKIEAISWCSLFCEDAVLKGEAFLPKYDWLRFVLQQKELINASLEKLGLPKLSGWYWVATEANPRCAWCLNADNGDSDYCLKLEEKSVRPMFWVAKNW